MKLKFLLAVAVCFTTHLVVSAQSAEIIHPPAISASNGYVNQKKGQFQNESPAVLLDPKTVALQKKWDISLSNHGITHGSNIPKSKMDSIKLEGRRLMHERDSLFPVLSQEEITEGRNLSITPYVNTSFKGNKYNFLNPPDNNMAVSDDGFVVSVINSSLFFADVNGAILLEENFSDFFAFLNLNGGYFDPKVLYDPDEDKFIIAVLNGNTPATSKIVVAFSAASNPMDHWWTYTFNGDPSGSNLWMDYPSIGISTDDIFITGNEYTADRVYSQVEMYQFGKGPAFKGENIFGVHYFDIKDAYGVSDFNVVPISYGFDGTIGPGFFLISTDVSGGTEAMLYYIDNNSSNNPNILTYHVSIPNYYAPFNGNMLGTTDQINTGDCRMMSGFYGDGIIHFVFDTRGDDFHTKVYYCRLTVADLTTSSIQIGLQPYEYAYPSIAPFSTSETDKSVLISFLRSSSTIYPEIRVAAVDNDMNFDGSHMVKSGKTFVNVEAGTVERWGDYSGISRRHSANGPEVWISGCYGNNEDNGSNVLSTWIAQITDQQADVAPTANFTANQTEIMTGQSVEFTDHSTNIPTSWSWTFPGGTPSTSNQQNPTVTYEQEGTYDVTLSVQNGFGSDNEIKTGFIKVTGQLQIPVADFTSDITSVNTGEVVHFQDLSENGPTSWQWFFPGGTPSLSGEQNPVVTYTEPGCHNVTLDAINNAGTDVITKTCYIDVLATAVTEPDIYFNKFVVYPNPVSDGRLNVEFEIEHRMELDFLVIDEQGRLIKNLLHRIVKGGLNDLAFNTDPLAPGAYYLIVNNEKADVLKTAKFIVLQ